jgi:hypothetical protein
VKKEINLIPKLYAGDKWGRKLYLNRNGYEGEFHMINADHLHGLDWRQRTERHLHQKLSHGPDKISKRWRKAKLHSLQHRVKKWNFFNRIHDTDKSHGFEIIVC